MAKGGTLGPAVQRRLQTAICQQLPILYKRVLSAQKEAILGP